MNIFRRIASAVTNFYLGLHEAAQRWNPKRGFLPWPYPRDARFDITSVDRMEIVRKSRGFYANNAIANRLCDLFEQFTVGPNGLQLIPDSSSEEWNQSATVRLGGWFSMCDLTSRMHFSTIQSICACVWFTDGEVFIQKTYGDEVQQNGKVVRRPRIQLIEGHRVGSPDTAQTSGRIIHDGVEVDGRGRPIAYWIKEALTDTGGFLMPGEQTFKRVSADQIIHIFEPSRPGQYRGLPFLSPVINDLQDLDELQQFAMGKAKENSSITRVLETASGEMPTPANLIRQKFDQKNQNSAGEDITETRTKFMQAIFGARAMAIKTGEKLTEWLNNSPTVAERELWSLLTSRICIGVGIPKILVFPESIQGTVARGDFDVANAFFRARSQVLATAFTEVYTFVMGWEVMNTLELSDPPTDWRNVFVCPPRSVNVDVGYNSAATIADIEAGLTTYRTEYAKRGYHWRVEIRQRAKEEAFLDRVAKEEGTTPERIRKSIGENLKAAMQSEADAKDKADNEKALTE